MPKVFTSFSLPLSCDWEYRQAGIKHPKRRAYRATLAVVVWPTKRKYRKHASKSKGSKACCNYWEKKKHRPKGHAGPYHAEIHLRVGWTTAPIVVHELTHAIGELPKRAGRPNDSGKRGEVAAYRMQRLVEAIGRELVAAGLQFQPAKMDPCR